MSNDIATPRDLFLIKESCIRQLPFADTSIGLVNKFDIFSDSYLGDFIVDVTKDQKAIGLAINGWIITKVYFEKDITLKNRKIQA